jgi:acetyl esterase/lipase
MATALDAATGRRPSRRLLAATALGWAVLGLLLALLIVLPVPNIGFPAVVVLWLLAVLVEGYSLVLAGFALLGLALAALARRAGLRKTSLIAVVLGVLTVALSLVPVVQGWRAASHEGVALSLSEYFSYPSTGSPETVTYARPGGEELGLDVRRPLEEGHRAWPEGRPAVVTVHGGGGVFGSRSEDAYWAQWLAEQGYVVFSIDYRLGPPLRWQDATGDVKCAVGWVTQHADRYDVDPDRIALLGHSAGGLLALLAAYTEGDPRLPPSCDVRDAGVEAVAAFYPSTDLARLAEVRSPWWRPNLLSSVDDSTGGTPESGLAGDLHLTSPTSHVDRGDPPTFLAHGSEDQWVPPEQSELLADRLETAGVPYRLIKVPGANHGFDVVWGGWCTQVVRDQLEVFLENGTAAQ